MSSAFRLSLIIPTLNEEDNIQKLLDALSKNPDLNHLEIIVVDASSTDNTRGVIANYRFVKCIESKKASRPHQLNLGAEQSSADWLYFVHADVQLPEDFLHDIERASRKYQIGCYRYRFNSTSWLLKINAFFTRFPMIWCRGGDQTLFVSRNLYGRLNGYDEYFSVMEDFDIIRRARELTPFYIIPKDVIVSARKYNQNGYFKVQFVNLKAFGMYREGVSPDEIRRFYKEALSLENY